MSFLGILVNLLILAAFVGYVWLVVVAFKHSTLWGVFVLFLSPITAVIFAIKNWEDSKRPFLVYIGTSTSAFALGLYLLFYISAPMLAMVGEANQGGEMDPGKVAQSMNTMMNRMEQVGNLDAEEKAQLGEMRKVLNDQILADVKPDVDATEAAAAALVAREISSDPPTGPSTLPTHPEISSRSSIANELTGTMTPDGYRSIPLESASKYVGETVRVLEKGGRALTGKLKAIDENGLTLERRFTTGTFAIEVSSRDVESLQVYLR